MSDARIPAFRAVSVGSSGESELPGKDHFVHCHDLFALPGQEFGVILSGLDHEGPPGRPGIWSGGVRSQPGTEPGNERPRGFPCPTTRRRPPGGGLP
jgi:hypothetical protein